MLSHGAAAFLIPQQMPNATDEGITWRPTRHNSICAYTHALGPVRALLAGVEHNANWATAHGCTFTLFTRRLGNEPELHASWEKVRGAQSLLERPVCQWLLHMDADAIVRDVTRSPLELLERMQQEVVAGATPPVFFTSCNSPLGRGLECSAGPAPTDVCCGRSRKTKGCAIGQFDDGPDAPFPCLINSGVFFVHNTAKARRMVDEWYTYRCRTKGTRGAPCNREGTRGDDPFYEQEALNQIKQAEPGRIEIVGGQAFNTHSSFSSSMLHTADPAAIFNLALRLSTGYEPEGGKPLNSTRYAPIARDTFGEPFGSAQLQRRFDDDVGPCAHDPHSFICHGFARPAAMKQQLLMTVARQARPTLEKMLGQLQHLRYTSVLQAQARTEQLGSDATVRRQMKKPRKVAVVNSKFYKSKAKFQAAHVAETETEGPVAALKAEAPDDAGGNATAATAHTPSAHDPRCPFRGCVAVCLSGMLKTFMAADVQASFARQHRAGYEYFVSTDTPLPTHPRVRVGPIKAWSVDSTPMIFTDDVRTPNVGKPGGGHAGCPAHTCGHRFLLPMARRFAACYTAMEDVEAAEAKTYRYVFKMRPDHILTKRLPHVADFVGAPGVVHLWDDQVCDLPTSPQKPDFSLSFAAHR